MPLTPLIDKAIKFMPVLDRNQSQTVIQSNIQVEKIPVFKKIDIDYVMNNQPSQETIEIIQELLMD